MPGNWHFLKYAMSTFEPSNSDTYFGLPSGLAGWAGGGGFFKEATWGGRGVPCTLEDCVHACRWRQTVYHTWLPILYRFHNDNTVTAACSESKVMYKPTCLFRPSDATSFRVRTNVFGIQLSRCVARPPCALCALYAICSAGG